jgi:hypothetical protein
VVSDVAAGAKLAGLYGRPLMEYQRIWVAQAQLPEMLRRLRALERRLEELTKGE